MSPTSYRAAPPRVGVGQVRYLPATRLATLDTERTMGLFGKRKASAAELAELQGDVCALRNQLVESEQARENMARQLIGVQARFMALSDSAADKSELEERFEQVERRLSAVAPLSERVDTFGGELGDATARLDELAG